MQAISLASALVLVGLGIAAAQAAPATDTDDSTPTAEQAPRLADGFFDHLRAHEHHGEHRGHLGRHWRDDDDDDDDDEGRTTSQRPADPNAADAPLPDNGVFTPGKARPKVEVQ